MEDKYLQLGRLIAGQCPHGFREARLEGELDTDRTNLKLTWTGQDQSEAGAPLEGVAMDEIHAALNDIREEMARQSGGDRWRKFVVTLRQGGHFRLDVSS